MGNSASTENKEKVNKNNQKTKSFRIGLSFGKGMANVEGHAQIGHTSHTKKIYGENAFSKIFNENNKNIERIENDKSINTKRMDNGEME